MNIIQSVEVTSPASRKDGPLVIKKEAPEQDAISQLIQLNRNEKNLPNSFFDDSALIRINYNYIEFSCFKRTPKGA